MEEKEGQAKPASAPAAGSIEQPPQEDINEVRKKSAVTAGVVFGTVILLDYATQTLTDHGDEPALLVLELSTWLSLLLYLWAVFLTCVLATTDRRHRLGVRALLAVLASIVGAVSASVLAYTAGTAVVGMVLMYLVALCVAGFFAWCLGDYLRTRNSAETASTSSPEESQLEALLKEKSNANDKLAHDHNARDLEAGLLYFSGA